MFIHPALVRELGAYSEDLRKRGESQGARALAAVCEGLRRFGWTREQSVRVREVLRSLEGVGAWERHGKVLEPLMEFPTRPPQTGKRPRNPDLLQ